MIERNARWALLGVLLLCAGCFSGPGTLDMMPGPTYHRAFEVREFGSAPSEEVPPRVRILYATDREPAVEGDDEPFYANERGGELRLGEARVRLGTGVMWEDGEVDPAVAGLLLRMESLSFINVTKAERAASGNGHGYFTKSPWVSSDLLATFAFGLSPGERGLVRPSGSPVWEFPPDYADRLRAAAAAAKEE